MHYCNDASNGAEPEAATEGLATSTFDPIALGGLPTSASRSQGPALRAEGDASDSLQDADFIAHAVDVLSPAPDDDAFAADAFAPRADRASTLEVGAFRSLRAPKAARPPP